MLEISEKLFERWNKEGIVYCHWKSNEHLKEGLNGLTDLDVLLSDSDKIRGEQSLRELDFLQCKSQYGSCYPYVNDWIGFDHQTGSIIHLHLHYRIVTGHKGMKEYTLPWTNEVLQTRLKSNDTGVYMTNPTLELLTLYTRIGLKADLYSLIKAKLGRFKLNSDVKIEVDYLKPLVDWGELLEWISKFYGDGADQFFKLIQKEQIDSRTFLQIVSLSQEAMYKYRRVNHIRLKEVYYTFKVKFRSYLKKKGWNLITRKVPITGNGLIVAFIGQDGAGKSTVTEEIRKWLTWKLDARRFYLGSGDHYHSWQKLILNFFPKHGLTMPIHAFLRLSMYTTLAKDVSKTVRNARCYAEKGGIALFDRYPQTIFHGINDGPKIREKIPNNKLLRSLFLRFADREEFLLRQAEKITPDIVFKLLLPPEESIRRKPQEDLEYVKMKHEIIKQLQFPHSKVIMIDATQDYQQELIMIKRVIWDSIPKL